MLWSQFKPLIRHFTEEEQTLIKTGFDFGLEAHGDQKRKSGELYFTHPIAVASILINYNADVETIIAALLHDVLEDTEITLDDVQNKFGSTVANIVDGLTKIMPNLVANKPDLDRKLETTRKMIRSMETDIRVMVIKLADRLHNMRTITFNKLESQQRNAKETLEVFVPIADRLCMQDIRDELANISVAILYPEVFANIKIHKAEYERITNKTISEMNTKLSKQLKNVPYEVEFEERQWKKWKKQFEEGSTAINQVTLVFTCSTINECYQILGALHQEWKRELLSFKEFINQPMLNGYQGLHTTVFLPDGIHVRCKIRTTEMDTYCHYGIATKCFDNKPEGLLTYLPWGKQIDSITEQDNVKSDDFWESLKNDILGESIFVHGSDDQLFAIPQGSSVLDALFYLYGEKALYVTNVTANNVVIDLWTDVPHGNRLDIVTQRTRTVELEWLQYAQTRFAISNIQKALTKRPYETNIRIGKDLLQAELTKYNRGFIEEFSFGSAGVNASELEKYYLKIATGKQDVQTVYNTLFKNNKKLLINAPSDTTIVVKSQHAIQEKLLAILKRFKIEIHSNRMARTNSGRQYKMRLIANAEQIESAQEAIEHIPNVSVHNTTGQFKMYMYACIVTALWAADILLIKKVLTPFYNPIDITIVRFAVMAICATILFGIHKFTLGKNGSKLKLIKFTSKRLIASGLALFSIGLFTYISYQELNSIEYAALINAAVLIGFSNKLHHAKKNIILVGIITLASLIPIIMNPAVTSLGLMSGFMTAIGFLVYNYTSKAYQQHQQIRSRYPQFFLSVASIAFICSLSLLHRSSIDLLRMSDALFLIGYHVLFTSIPYILLFQFSKYQRLEAIGALVPVCFPVALLLHTVFISEPSHWLYWIAFCGTLIWITFQIEGSQHK